MTKADETETVSDVTWEEPVESRPRYDWSVIAEKLRANPNAWAKVFDDDKTSLVNAIRQGAIRVLDPTLGFEVQTRNNVREPERRCALYMRYVPGASFPRNKTTKPKKGPAKRRGRKKAKDGRGDDDHGDRESDRRPGLEVHSVGGGGE
jgi:hypothetical protein